MARCTFTTSVTEEVDAVSGNARDAPHATILCMRPCASCSAACEAAGSWSRRIAYGSFVNFNGTTETGRIERICNERSPQYPGANRRAITEEAIAAGPGALR